jgi:hypothetical protein
MSLTKNISDLASLLTPTNSGNLITIGSTGAPLTISSNGLNPNGIFTSITVGSGSTGLVLRTDANSPSNHAAIFSTQTTPTLTNYTLLFNGSNTYLNGPAVLGLAVNGTKQVNIDASQTQIFSGTTSTSGLIPTVNVDVTGITLYQGKLTFSDGTYLTTAPISSISAITFNNVTTSTYSSVLTDATYNNHQGDTLLLNSASPQTVTIPVNSSVSYPVGSTIEAMQMGTGKVTFVADVGVTINSANGFKSIGVQYMGITLMQTATNVWLLLGGLVA